jgi:serine/threonine-protein kinase
VLKRITKIAALFGVFALAAAGSAYLTLTWIVKGQEAVEVPDLRGKDVVHVLEILTDLGLNAKVRQLDYSDTVPADAVILQDPNPGDTIKKGRDVRIVISKGPRTVFTPNLTDRSVPEGTIVLEENGLCRGHLSETYSERTVKGRIIAQEPLPGTQVDRHRCVNLLVSLGQRPKPFSMPDLTGLTPESAVLEIEARGMVVGEISRVSEQDRLPNAVIRQTPPPGYPAIEGGTVDLVINMAGAIELLKPGATSRQVLFRYRAGNGFLNRQLRVLLTGFGRPVVIFEDFVKPATRLWFIAPGQPGAEVLIFENNERIAPQDILQLTGRLVDAPEIEAAFNMHN